ncbi:MAG: hypothetical protein CL663_04915 [Bacteroidetes bacterium]|nr:hypothetical protein [Bacteroidota bacterium]
MKLECWLKFGQNHSDDHIKSVENSYIHFRNRLISKIFRVTRKVLGLKSNATPINTKYHVQDIDQTKTKYKSKLLLKKFDFEPDIILVLFMHDFLSFKNIHEFSKETNAKLFLFPMDMSPFTGACHFAWDCLKYTKECGECPAIYSKELNDHSRKNLFFKRKYSHKTDLTLIIGNKFVAEQAAASAIFKDKKIISGIYPVPDKTIFHKKDSTSCKERFGIDPSKKVFFIGSASFKDIRKGMHELAQALLMLDQNNPEFKKDIVLLVAGLNSNVLTSLVPLECVQIDFITNYNELAEAYNAADFYISPSLEDSGPTMVVQSILCGTPVISFNFGFSMEYIIHGESGFTSDEKTIEALCGLIKQAIEQDPEQFKKMEAKVISIAQTISQEESINNLIKLFN